MNVCVDVYKILRVCNMFCLARQMNHIEIKLVFNCFSRNNDKMTAIKFKVEVQTVKFYEFYINVYSVQFTYRLE